MVSEVSREYYRKLCETPGFGANGFDLAGLRLCMGARRKPADPEGLCTAVEVDGRAAWSVRAPGADPDRRLMYLDGGGYVSGSGVFHLPLAARWEIGKG